MTLARFKVVQKEKKRERVRLDVETSVLEVGTASDCGLVLVDPIAAARHCAFALVGDAFVVRDSGSDTGTFRNGRAVVGDVTLADGDEVVVGTTRLRLRHEGATPPTLVLQLASLELGFRPGRSGEFASDPDTMARREVDLSRWPALRTANRTAARLLIVGLPLLLLWPRARQTLTDPGQLSNGHAALFTAAAASRFPRQAELAQTQGCGVCHDSFFGTPDERCAQCHQGLVQDQHPFASTTEDPKRVRRPLDGYTCAPCHQEHHGAKLSKPTHEQTKELCTDCHGGTDIEAANYAAERTPKPVEQTPRAYGGFRFAHADHTKVDCTLCHQRRDTATGSRAVADFGSLEFATCARCHRQGELDASVPAAARPKPEHVWSITWHGSRDGDTTCGRCHAKGEGAGGFGPGFLPVARLANDADTYGKTRARYEVMPRSHRSLLADGARDCTACHREAARRLSQPAVRPFWHELHLRASPRGLTEDGARVAASAECDTCHGDLRQSKQLTDHATMAYACASDATCGTCHREGTREATEAAILLPKATALPTLPTSSANDFAHADHLDFGRPTLTAGCFTCHDFAPTNGDAPFAVPITKPQAKSCLPCHEQHDHVAGGACRRCHGAEKGAYNDFLGKNPPAERQQTPRPWPVDSAFSHFTPGHRESTEKDCATCHRQQSDVAGRKDLATLRAPTEADDACRTCHLGERQRFHWR